MGMLDNTKAMAEKAQKEFSDNLKNFCSNADSLKPYTADDATYDKLVKEVSAATAKNESIAAFESRLNALGNVVVALAKSLGLISIV